MTHEIRTSINGIIGMIELSIDTAVNDDQRNIFRIIDAEAGALLGLINGVLNWKLFRIRILNDGRTLVSAYS